VGRWAISRSAERDDLPRDVRARDHGHRRLEAGNAAQDHRIEAVECDRSHADDGLATTRLGIPRVAIGHIVERPVSLEYGGFHLNSVLDIGGRSDA
jgi:hypothetical protein